MIMGSDGEAEDPPSCIPGNALVVDPKLPFRPLAKYSLQKILNMVPPLQLLSGLGTVFSTDSNAHVRRTSCCLRSP